MKWSRSLSLSVCACGWAFLLLVCVVRGSVEAVSGECEGCKDLVVLLERFKEKEDNVILQFYCKDEGCMNEYESHIRKMRTLVSIGESKESICKMIGKCPPEHLSAQGLNTEKGHCGICTGFLEGIWDKVSREMIETGWNRSCSKLSITRPYCEQASFLDSLVSTSHLLVQNMQPRDVCEAVSVCDPKVSLQVDAAMDYSCALCRSIITFAKQQYNLNPDLNAVLDNLCHQVPTNLQEKCYSMTNTTLLSYSLSTNMDPATTCKLSDCYPGPEAKTLKSPPKVTPKVRMGSAAFVVTCQGCQWALSAIESYLSQESTEAELGGVLSELCTILPDPYAKICQNLVTVYLSEGVIFVLDILTPPYICSKLNVCDFS